MIQYKMQSNEQNTIITRLDRRGREEGRRRRVGISSSIIQITYFCVYIYSYDKLLQVKAINHMKTSLMKDICNKQNNNNIRRSYHQFT